MLLAFISEDSSHFIKGTVSFYDHLIVMLSRQWCDDVSSLTAKAQEHNLQSCCVKGMNCHSEIVR